MVRTGPAQLPGRQSAPPCLVCFNSTTPPCSVSSLHAWGYRGAGDQQILKQLVHRLRQKVERDPAAPEYGLTIPGAGYMPQRGVG
jgi:hypothetical protein